MKRNKMVTLLLITIISIGIAFNVQAKGLSSRGGSRSSFHSSSFKSNKSSSFKSNSFKIKYPKRFKGGKFKVNKNMNKSKNTNTNTNTNANKNINNTVIYNHYNAPKYNTTYYTPHGNSFRGSFWDNYWMYRILTNHNTVVVNRSNGTWETIDYGYSGIWKDILTLIIAIVIITFIIKKVRNRRR
ncbi:hypothetical protein [Clostridium sp. Marseille-Q2269]|uniref:hypothetical protein n=1 Tax=Clostridium sp. Marseille-Q2269 TaxID=2942205 RepID=UPI0020733A08|nr:hypothetical protein [Clostridium sp. Marseille-Q2269]